MQISWDEYKVAVSAQTQNYRKYIYRGQSNSDWVLSTTIHRTGKITTHSDFLFYFKNIRPFVQEPVETWDGSKEIYLILAISVVPIIPPTSWISNAPFWIGHFHPISQHISL